jgi:7,8-dihydroneopterin aldolase/epimerase/oxygenase
MSLRSKWTVRVEELCTRLRVGIYPHELEHQPILLSLRISGLAETFPSSLAECFDYEPICRWALEQWPESPHTPLLETRLNELIERVFNEDKRIRDVWFGLYKPQAISSTKFVGLERELTRRQFEEQQRSRSHLTALTKSKKRVTSRSIATTD